MHQSLAFFVALLAYLGFSAAQLVTPLVLPAIQTSISTSAYNPALTNAGGTTNSAGTFNVVSLSRSSSFAYNSEIPVTTSFVISEASFAPDNRQTINYQTQVSQPGSLTGAQNSATASSISLATTRSNVQSISAITNFSNTDAATVSFHMGSAWTVLLSVTAAVFGAVFIL